MKQELKDNLLEYLGELTYDLEHEAEYFKKGCIVGKLKAIHTLLKLTYVEPNWRLDYKGILKRVSKPHLDITDPPIVNNGDLI